MSDFQVFSIASQKANWLTARQTVIASNIANSSTPGFKAKDVEPFSAVLDGVGAGLSVTNSRHMNIGGGSARSAETATRIDPFGKTTHSGNSVSIERELIKSSEVTGAFSLNSNIIKAFHRMMLMSVRG